MQEQMKNDSYALKEVNIRLCLKEGDTLYSRAPLSDPAAAVTVMADMMKELDREMLCVVNTDNKMKPLSYNIVTIGTINQTVIPTQNVFKSAILSNAARVIVLHNHPSGDLTPSLEDYDATRRLVAAGKLLDIPVEDHVIIAGGTGRFYSFREHYSDIFSGKTDLDYIHNVLLPKMKEPEEAYGNNHTEDTERSSDSSDYPVFREPEKDDFRPRSTYEILETEPGYEITPSFGNGKVPAEYNVNRNDDYEK